MTRLDILFVWLNVHGGGFHKLLTLHERLASAGHSCEMLLCSGPPRGLKIGTDVPEALLPELAERGIHFLPRAEALRRAEDLRARLTVFDAHHDEDLPKIIAALRHRGARTAQMATLLGDFTYHGAEYLLMQHPLTLFFELEYSRTKSSRGLYGAKGVYFTGNIFFEPTVNRLVNDFPDREAFCARYGFNPARPLCLWLPNASDATSEAYGQVVHAAKQAGVNLAVKLHPWEYALKKYGAEGMDYWGLGRTTDEIWGVRAVDETDGAWAYRYCDVAVMRGSATSLELPFWEKPGVLLPGTSHVGLLRAQSALVRSCSVPLPGAQALAPLLAGPLPRFTSADYAAARGQVRLDTQRDAYVQTVEALERILAAPENAPDLGALTPLKRLYDPFVGLGFIRSLSPTRCLRYLLGRALRRLRN